MWVFQESLSLHEIGEAEDILMSFSDKQLGRKYDSHPTKVERTGDKTFVVHHDSNDRFECTAKSSADVQKVLRRKFTRPVPLFHGLQFDEMGRIVE
jgi:hypothetical protein